MGDWWNSFTTPVIFKEEGVACRFPFALGPDIEIDGLK